MGLRFGSRGHSNTSIKYYTTSSKLKNSLSPFSHQLHGLQKSFSSEIDFCKTEGEHRRWELEPYPPSLCCVSLHQFPGILLSNWLLQLCCAALVLWLPSVSAVCWRVTELPVWRHLFFNLSLTQDRCYLTTRLWQSTAPSQWFSLLWGCPSWGQRSLSPPCPLRALSQPSLTAFDSQVPMSRYK